MRERVESALERIRPAVQMDGGDVQLVDVTEDGVVTVQMMGACGGCPMSMLTLKAGIERIIKSQVPEVTEIVAV
ncbi:MAG TPA: NifU family protein [Limnochordales bacterium]|nr:NifU family protein [Limnochordales bacterium]